MRGQGGGSKRNADSYETLKKPPRQPGEPHYRCLHCGRYKCDRPLRLCLECQGEMKRLLEDLPEDE